MINNIQSHWLLGFTTFPTGFLPQLSQFVHITTHTRRFAPKKTPRLRLASSAKGLAWRRLVTAWPKLWPLVRSKTTKKRCSSFYYAMCAHNQPTLSNMWTLKTKINISKEKSTYQNKNKHIINQPFQTNHNQTLSGTPHKPALGWRGCCAAHGCRDRAYYFWSGASRWPVSLVKWYKMVVFCWMFFLNMRIRDLKTYIVHLKV